METVPIDEAASLVVALDTLHLELQSSLTQTTQLWSRQQRDLADRVLRILLDTPDYKPSPLVIQALGSSFADGPILSAGLRAGLLVSGTGDDARGSMRENPEGSGLIDRIKQAFS